ncbi:MAG: chitobiase/beta-hexosaminidase C-terminal domain-containing protein [Bacteroidales bacterium]|nr:chitobiase/beta-hexosaminidase C-terminal domain-containing protein [Bacteroidales bacterium]
MLVIKDLCITANPGNYTSAPGVSITGQAAPGGGFWTATASLACEQGSAAVYYTTDGATPTDQSTLYAEAFDLTATTHIKAIAIRNGISSAVTDTTITFVPPFAPTVSVTGQPKDGGGYWTAIASLACQPDNAEIRYTTDGSTPASQSELYSAPFPLPATATVKAIAILGALQSSVSEEVITVAGAQTAALPFTESFAGSLGNWYPYSQTGDQVWTAKQDGNTFAEMDGADEQIVAQDNEDWLISPAFTAAEGCSLAFAFASAQPFSSGDPVVLKYSSDYAGVGDPAVAAWDDATGVTWAAGAAWTESGEILLAATAPVRFAFVYTSSTGGASVWQVSDIRAYNRDFTPPSAPSDLRATPAETGIDLSWTASDDNLGIASYAVYMNGDSLTHIAGTGCTATGLTAGTEYTFSVTAVDEAGNRSDAAQVRATTLQATGVEGFETGAAKAYWARGAVRLLYLEGHVCRIYTTSGQLQEAFVAASPDETHPVSLPEGIYILTAQKANDRKTFKLKIEK